MSERNVLVKNIKHPFLVGLHYSFQTKDKLYFVLDYLNGGEVMLFEVDAFRTRLYYSFSSICNVKSAFRRIVHVSTRRRSRPHSATCTRSTSFTGALSCEVPLSSEYQSFRDLKPENLLLSDEGHLIITDFGLCKEGMKGNETTTTFCGTPEYLAPEVVLKQAYDKTVDWWCLGSVLYEMLFGLVGYPN